MAPNTSAFSSRQMAQEIVTMSISMEELAQKSFIDSMRDASNNPELVSIIEDITDGSYTEVTQELISRIDGLNINTTDLQRIMNQAFSLSGAISLKNTELGISFDLFNPRAVEYLRQLGVDIDSLSGSVKENLKNIFQKAIEGELGKAEVRRLVTKQIGLLPQHSDAVDRYYESLINQGKGVRESKKLASEYAERLLLYRANLIARTEIGRAVGFGQWELWQQALEENVIPVNAVRQWITSYDEMVCDICRPMDGETAPINGQWYVDGRPVDIPEEAHPQCRCTSGLVFPTSISKADPIGYEVWLLNKGDYVGHPFRGNQHTGGIPARGGAGSGGGRPKSPKEKYPIDAPYYHGTHHKLKVGDILTPEGAKEKGSNYDKFRTEHIENVHATTTIKRATNWGMVAGLTVPPFMPVRVYELKALDDVKLDASGTRHPEDVTSKKFEVVREVKEFQNRLHELSPDQAREWQMKFLTETPEIEKGDYVGHPFRGNQHTGGIYHGPRFEVKVKDAASSYAEDVLPEFIKDTSPVINLAKISHRVNPNVLGTMSLEDAGELTGADLKSREFTVSGPDGEWVATEIGSGTDFVKARSVYISESKHVSGEFSMDDWKGDYGCWMHRVAASSIMGIELRKNMVGSFIDRVWFDDRPDSGYEIQRIAQNLLKNGTPFIPDSQVRFDMKQAGIGERQATFVYNEEGSKVVGTLSDSELASKVDAAKREASSYIASAYNAVNAIHKKALSYKTDDKGKSGMPMPTDLPTPKTKSGVPTDENPSQAIVTKRTSYRGLSNIPDESSIIAAPVGSTYKVPLTSFSEDLSMASQYVMADQTGTYGPMQTYGKNNVEVSHESGLFGVRNSGKGVSRRMSQVVTAGEFKIVERLKPFSEGNLTPIWRVKVQQVSTFDPETNNYVPIDRDNDGIVLEGKEEERYTFTLKKSSDLVENWVWYGMFDSSSELAVGNKKVSRTLSIKKGDYAGHPFRGNQHTGGIYEYKAKLTREPKNKSEGDGYDISVKEKTIRVDDPLTASENLAGLGNLHDFMQELHKTIDDYGSDSFEAMALAEDFSERIFDVTMKVDHPETNETLTIRSESDIEKIELSSNKLDVYGDVHISFSDSRYGQTGTFHRTIYLNPLFSGFQSYDPEPEGGWKYEVHNASFELPEDAQGLGIGTALVRHWEDQYAEAGFDKMSVLAASGNYSNGAWTWLKTGYEPYEGTLNKLILKQNDYAVGRAMRNANPRKIFEYKESEVKAGIKAIVAPLRNIDFKGNRFMKAEKEELIKKIISGYETMEPAAAVKAINDFRSGYDVRARHPSTDAYNTLIRNYVASAGSEANAILSLAYQEEDIGKDFKEFLKTEASWSGSKKPEEIEFRDAVLSKSFSSAQKVMNDWMLKDPAGLENDDPKFVKQLLRAIKKDRRKITKGDFAGHPFRGNQHTGGIYHGYSGTKQGRPRKLNYYQKKVKEAVEALGLNPAHFDFFASDPALASALADEFMEDNSPVVSSSVNRQVSTDPSDNFKYEYALEGENGTTVLKGDMGVSFNYELWRGNLGCWMSRVVSAGAMGMELRESMVGSFGNRVGEDQDPIFEAIGVIASKGDLPQDEDGRRYFWKEHLVLASSGRMEPSRVKTYIDEEQYAEAIEKATQWVEHTYAGVYQIYQNAEANKENLHMRDLYRGLSNVPDSSSLIAAPIGHKYKAPLTSFTGNRTSAADFAKINLAASPHQMTSGKQSVVVKCIGSKFGLLDPDNRYAPFGEVVGQFVMAGEFTIVDRTFSAVENQWEVTVQQTGVINPNKSPYDVTPNKDMLPIEQVDPRPKPDALTRKLESYLGLSKAASSNVVENWAWYGMQDYYKEKLYKETMKRPNISKGDFAGHPFRGNQHTGGIYHGASGLKRSQKKKSGSSVRIGKPISATVGWGSGKKLKTMPEGMTWADVFGLDPKLASEVADEFMDDDSPIISQAKVTKSYDGDGNRVYTIEGPNGKTVDKDPYFEFQEEWEFGKWTGNFNCWMSRVAASSCLGLNLRESMIGTFGKRIGNRDVSWEAAGVILSKGAVLQDEDGRRYYMKPEDLMLEDTGGKQYITDDQYSLAKSLAFTYVMHAYSGTKRIFKNAQMKDKIKEKFYRGIDGVRTTSALLSAPVGYRYKIPVTSFTSDISVATEYAAFDASEDQMNFGDQNVLVTVDKGLYGLIDLREVKGQVVTAGEFEIKSRNYDPSLNIWKVNVEQVGAINPDDNSVLPIDADGDGVIFEGTDKERTITKSLDVVDNWAWYGLQDYYKETTKRPNISKGDYVGHPFRGNQHTGGIPDPNPIRSRIRAGKTLTGKTTPSALKAMAIKGGFTFDPKRGRMRSNGVAVAVSPEFEFTFSLEEFGKSGVKIIKDYVKKHASALAEPKAHLGAWVENEKVFLDVSVVKKGLSEAADLGRLNDQLAIFDLSTFTQYNRHRSPTTGEFLYLKEGEPVSRVDELGKAASSPVLLIPAESINNDSIVKIVEEILKGSA